MQQGRHKTKEDTWTTEELTKHLKAMQSEASNEKRPKEKRPHREESRDERTERRHKSDRKERRDKADSESDRHAERERRERHRYSESKRHADRERGERGNDSDRHAERERRERHNYPETEKHADRERRERHANPEPDRERDKDKAREHHREKEKSRDPDRQHVSGRHRVSERDQKKEQTYSGEKSATEHETYEISRDERKMRDSLEKSKHRNDDRERRHQERREKGKRKEESKEYEDRDMRHRKHREDLDSRDKEKERRRSDQKPSKEADSDMRPHRREKGIRGSKEERSAEDSVENSARRKDRPIKERHSQREEKEGQHREKREQKAEAHGPKPKYPDHEEGRIRRRHSRQSAADRGSDDEKEIEETIQNKDMAYEDSTNYEEDFEDYDEDFEEFSEEEKTPSDVQEQPPIQRNREIEEIQKAMQLENESIASVQKSHDFQHQEVEARELNDSPMKAHRGVFIDFGSAKQRQVTSQVASKQKKRSLEILRLIDLDYSSTFSLLDLAPVKEYEMYIRNFGKTNTKQAYVQCNDDAVDRDIQTEEIDTEEKWTQHPAEGAVVCGGLKNEMEDNASLTIKVNSQRLTNFLHSACQVMAVLLEENRAEHLSQSKVQSKEPCMSISESCFHLNTNLPFLQGWDVHLLQFSEAQRHLLMTVHCLSDSSDSSSTILSDKCLICVWNIWQPSAPQKILVCNSKVNCVCFSPGKASLVFAGTVDGSVLVWDLREDFSMHHTVQIKDYNWTLRSVTFSTDAVFTPVNHTHPVKAIEPVSGAEAKDHGMSTLSPQEGVSDLSFQLASLDEGGHLIFWVVVELRKADLAGSQSDLGLIPGGKVKLIHSSSIDLSDKFFHRDVLSSGIPETLNIKFLPQDSNHFVTGTDIGIVSHGTRYGLIETPLQYTSLNNKLRPSKITAIDFSPFGIPAFLAGCSDGCIRLHVISNEYPVMQWNDTTSGQSVIALQWSLARPAVFFVLDAASCIYVWDLLQNDLQPVAKESITSDPLQSMSVFGEPEKNSNVMGLALAKSSGKVEIHYIKKKWAKTQPKELEKLHLILQEIV